MYRKLILTGCLILLFVASFLLLQATRPGKQPAELQPPPQRIVSLAPSITEILFALDLGERVVGVTRFCDYPPATADLPTVGGFFDPNFEAIVGLKPDLIIMLKEHQQAASYFSDQGQRLLLVNHLTLDGILTSIEQIGEACRAPDRADALLAEMQAEMGAVAHQAGTKRPKVMIVVSRESGKLGQVYIAGEDGFYSELIRLAGGQNAYQGEVAFPVVTPEGILKMNPDIIIELVADMDERSLDPVALREDWAALPQIQAVENRRLHLVTEDYVVIPGPRFVQTLHVLADLIHPEAEEP